MTHIYSDILTKLIGSFFQLYSHMYIIIFRFKRIIHIQRAFQIYFPISNMYYKLIRYTSNNNIK